MGSLQINKTLKTYNTCLLYTSNGQQVGGEYTANVTASSNNDNNNHKYNLTATLPKRKMCIRDSS